MHVYGYVVLLGFALLLAGHGAEASKIMQVQGVIGNPFGRMLQGEPVIKTSVNGQGHMLRTVEQQKLGSSGSAGAGELRTATGGFVYTLLVTLTVLAFLSNGAFLVYVFWLSK